MNILSNLSDRLKDLICEKEINASALAEKIGVNPSVVSKYIRAERLPSVQTLIPIADFFNCSTDYLLGLSDKLEEVKFKPVPPFSQQFNFLLKNFKITKYRLEKQTGISGETLRRWQNGKFLPTVESLVKLAKHFDCSVDFIIGRES